MMKVRITTSMVSGQGGPWYQGEIHDLPDSVDVERLIKKGYVEAVEDIETVAEVEPVKTPEEIDAEVKDAEDKAKAEAEAQAANKPKTTQKKATKVTTADGVKPK